MTIKKASAAIEAALLKGETVVATVEGTLMPAGKIRGVLALTDQRILFRGSGVGHTSSLSFLLTQVAAVDLNKGLMTAHLTIQGGAGQTQVRVKYNDAVPFSEAAQRQLVTA